MAARSALVVLALMLAGCAGSADSQPTISKSSGVRLVLQPGDLDREWSVFDSGAQEGPDSPTGPRAKPTRFGRLGGWKARFRRPGTPQTRGALVIESRADLFAGESGARQELQALRSEVAEEYEPSPPLTGSDVGEGRVAGTLVQPGNRPIRYFFVAWRQENAVGSILVSGFDTKIDVGDALELASKQAARMEDEAG